MTIKEYLKQNNLKASTISKSTGIPYTTVSEIINGKTDIDKVQIGTGLKIAKACKLDFQVFYNICKDSYYLPEIPNGVLLLKNKAFYLECNLPGCKKEIYLCKVNSDNARFIKDMAEWTITSLLKQAEEEKQISEVESWTINSI